MLFEIEVEELAIHGRSCLVEGQLLKRLPGRSVNACFEDVQDGIRDGPPIASRL